MAHSNLSQFFSDSFVCFEREINGKPAFVVVMAVEFVLKDTFKGTKAGFLRFVSDRWRYSEHLRLLGALRMDESYHTPLPHI